MIAQVLVILAFLATLANSYDLRGSTTCVCTTVPCPVPGDNYLTEGESFVSFLFFFFLLFFSFFGLRSNIFPCQSFYLSTNPFINNINFLDNYLQVAEELVPTTTSLTMALLSSPVPVLPLPRPILTKVLTLLLALKIIQELLMMMVLRTVMLVTSWRTDSAVLAINQSTSSLK